MPPVNQAEYNALLAKNAELLSRLDEAEETLRAIRDGEADALLVSGPDGQQVFTLRSAELPYRSLVERMQEGAVTLTEDGIILYCNMRFSQMLRLPHEKVLATSAHQYVQPEQAAQFAALMRRGALQSAKAEISLCADNFYFPTYITAGPLPDEVEGRICLIVTDLTEQESLRRNKAEIEQLNERLQRSVTETHHRVKNSLQIIGAMVDMQVMEGNPTVPLSEVRRFGTQIKSLAVVHDLLTMEAKADGQAHYVSGKAVLEKLLPLLEFTSGERQFTAKIDDARLTSSQATGLALVTNEVISNALKHGKGRVEVIFKVSAAQAVLEVCDDGPGFPPNFDPRKLVTTGIGLVENLTRWDLGGQVRYENPVAGGAAVRIFMPLTLSDSEGPPGASG